MSRDAEVERGLVRAIVEAEDDDDEPRLVYADWLQSRGDPRGELIMIQCCEAKERVEVLENRVVTLVAHNAARLAGAWHGEAGDWRFRRGLLDELTLPLDTFAINAQALFELEELPAELIHVKTLVLQQPRSAPRFDELVKAPVGDAAYPACDAHAPAVAQAIARLRLRALSLQLAMSLTFARTIAQPSFAHLTSLAIESPVVERGAVPALLEAPLDRLRALRICCRLRDDDWEAIARAPRYQQVRSLEASGSLVTLSMMIRANPALTRLRIAQGVGVSSRLRPAEPAIPVYGEPSLLDVLAEVKPPLVELDLSNTRDPLDLRPLAKLRKLERLDLHNVQLGDVGAMEVARLRKLVALDIANTNIGADGLYSLLHGAPESLRELTISTARVPPELLARLAKRFVLRCKR